MPDFLCWEGMALPPAILSIFLFASNHTEWDIFERELSLRTTHNQATLVFLCMCLSLHMHHQHSHFTYLPIPKHICIRDHHGSNEIRRQYIYAYMSYRCIVVKHILSNPHATHAVLSLGTETYVFCQLTCALYIVQCRMIFYLTISTEYDRDICAPSINMYSTSHGVLSLGTGTYAFRLAKVASHGASRIQTWRPNWRLIGLAASTSVMHRLWSVWSRSEHKFSFPLQHLLMHFLLA